MANEICFRTLHLAKPWTLDSYKSVGGYSSLEKVLGGKMPPEEVLEQIKASNLRGRGGAGFPTGLKWSFISRENPGQKYVVCNADESEPGTFKDREILLNNPHQIIEGMIIAGYVIGATVGYNYVRGEFWLPYARMEQAVKEAEEQGYLGENILGSGFDFVMHNVQGAGAYICGEETALIESIEGKKGLPRFKPPFPATYGVYGKPTVVNNAESLASVPVIIQNGSAWFRELGVEGSGGCKIFSVSGHVEKPGNYEIPLGTPFTELLQMAGGVKGGRKLKAVIPGGSSVPVVPADVMLKVNMDYNSIRNAGSMLGAGSVIVMDEATDMVEVLTRVSKFYFVESCGQCTPCREGAGWLYRVLERIMQGGGTLRDLALLDEVAGKIMGKTICALGDAAAMPVRSFLKHFREEFVEKINKNKSKNKNIKQSA